MNIYTKLSSRIHIEDIFETLVYVEGSDKRKQELYELIYHEEDIIAYQALWILTHFNREENRWLFSKQKELIDELLRCEHPGKRRLLLNLLLKQPLVQPVRVDFLDFCLDRMLSAEELPGVQTLCMKLAYELCLPIPELLQEFRISLEIMEPELLPASIRSVRKNVINAMRKGKSLV